jgi:hypothetical protein
MEKVNNSNDARSRRYQRRHRGGAIIYVVIAATALIGLCSLAADFGLVQLSRAELRSAVDAVNLTAATGLPVGPAEVRKRAKAIALANKVNGRPLVLEDGDIELGRWDPTHGQFVVLTGSNEVQATAVRVTARLIDQRGTSIPLVFAPVILLVLQRAVRCQAGGSDPSELALRKRGRAFAGGAGDSHRLGPDHGAAAKRELQLCVSHAAHQRHQPLRATGHADLQRHRHLRRIEGSHPGIC